MGTITRHSGSPFARGETSSAADLEADIKACYDEFNGNIDDANLSSDVKLDGAKFQDNSLTATEFSTTAADLLTIHKQATRGYVSTASAGESLIETFNLWTDVPGIPGITATAYTSRDVIVARFTATYTQGIPAGAFWEWSFSINGSGSGVVIHKNNMLANGSLLGTVHTVSYHWSFVAGSPGPFNIRPIYYMGNLSSSGTALATFTTLLLGALSVPFEANRIFSVSVLPG